MIKKVDKGQFVLRITSRIEKNSITKRNGKSQAMCPVQLENAVNEINEIFTAENKRRMGKEASREDRDE